MDFAQPPYAVKIDASLHGIKCYLCCRLQYVHIDVCFPFPFLLLLSPYCAVCIFLFTLNCHPSPSSFSSSKESVAVKSTFQKFLLLFANNGNILFKELLSRSCVVVNIYIYIYKFFFSSFFMILSLIARWQKSGKLGSSKCSESMDSCIQR